jgi:hypothetical protein
MTDAAGVPPRRDRHDSQLREPALAATKQQLGDTLPERPTVYLHPHQGGPAPRSRGRAGFDG